ncbi:hypothetical protein AB205_0002990, partial [Aquarana catesbeiana]
QHWFTELPPVLTFELSRFEFNQALGRPEKIHNKLEFPPCLYMDRYIHKNREITRIKRDEIKRLKEHLTVLQQRLESTMEHQGPSSSSEPQSNQRSVIHKPFTQSRIPPDLPMHPAPRHITDEELTVLEGCLHRWRTEVETDTRDLQDSIGRIHRTIELMYSDKLMTQEYDKETGQVLSGMDTLPPDLKEFVKEDNRRFEKELEEWNKEQLRKAEQEKMLISQKTIKPPPASVSAPVKEPEYLEQPTRAELPEETMEETTNAISQAATESEDKGPEAVLQTVRISLILLC